MERKVLNNFHGIKKIIVYKKNNNELLKRTITAVILLLFLSVFLFFGISSLDLYGWTGFNLLERRSFGFTYLFIGIFLLFFVLLEYYNVYIKNKKLFLFYILFFISSLLISYAPTFLYYLDYLHFYKLDSNVVKLAIGLIEVCGFLISLILLISINKKFLKYFSRKEIIPFYLIFFLISYFFFFFNLILLLHAWTTIIILWIPVMFTDSLAYLGGKKFGKHKLAPKISPKKTWEGLMFGFIGGIASIIIVGSFFLLDRSVSLNDYSYEIINNNTQGNIFSTIYFYDTKYSYIYVYFLVLLCFGILISLFTTFGDLSFSYFKRLIKIKDFSNLLPGHGGFLDRIDSIIFVIIVFGIYYLISSGVNDDIFPFLPYFPK